LTSRIVFAVRHKVPLGSVLEGDLPESERKASGDALSCLDDNEGSNPSKNLSNTALDALSALDESENAAKDGERKASEPATAGRPEVSAN